MNLFMMIGLMINAACIVINRFFWEIPSKIAVPVYTIGVICFVIGIAQMSRTV